MPIPGRSQETYNKAWHTSKFTSVPGLVAVSLLYISWKKQLFVNRMFVMNADID